MAPLKTFDIDTYQPDAVHTYQLDANFFALFENTLLHHGQLTATVQLSKAPTNIQLQFHIQGHVELACDRSLQPFDHPISLHQEVNFKLGDKDQELDANLYTIGPRTTIINVAQHLYDLIHLAVPMKKIHPQLRQAADQTINN